MLSLAFSVLFLAQTAPSTPVTIPVTQAVQIVDSAPATTQSSAGSIAPASQATTQAGGTAPAGPAEQAPWWANIMHSMNPMVLMVIALGVFMVFSIRNKRAQERAQQEKLGAIKRGDRVQTIGGIIGNVVQTEDSRILVKVDESNNTKIWFARSAVGRVLGEEKSADTKPK